jgi:DNA (cytosine-5)-methyltransferase 1
MSTLKGVSLFSGAGIGDLGFRAAGVEFLAMCELEKDRSALAELNFPEARHFAKDVREAADDLCAFVEGKLSESRDELFLVSCTAPCQGMSKNGQGTLLNNIRKGVRPKLDPRNRLILPGLKIIQRLRPMWVVFENVTEMRNTVIEDDEQDLHSILEIVDAHLRPHGYVGAAYDVDFADYGIPQRRRRLITVYTRYPKAAELFETGVPLIPAATHAKYPRGRLKAWVSVEEALADFPALDARCAKTATCDELPFHYVPVLDAKKYEWIRHTPPGKSAFDNQCVNSSCGYFDNLTHGSSHGADGINRAHKTTPLYCERCGSLLPRPYKEEKDGTKRIMSGYTSAYKRMDGLLPAPALTRNLSYPCSDQKIHPTQNRVLSLAEAMRLQTIDQYAYRWGPVASAKGAGYVMKEQVPDSLIRLVIGESIPPRFLELQSDYIQRFRAPVGQAGGGVHPAARSCPVQRALWELKR